MAIGTPIERYAVRAGFNGSVQAINPATTIAAGTTAIMIAHGVGVSVNGDNVLVSVTDSAGNTWTVDHTYGPVASDANAISFASGRIVTQVTNADTVTLTWAVSGNVQRTIWIQEVSGLATSSRFDASADATAISGSPSAGPTAALAQADEIVFCSSGNNTATSTWTKGATYTDVTTPSIGSISALEYKIVSSVAAVTGDGTWAPPVRWNASVATYKGAAAVSDANLAPVIYGRGAA